MQASQVTEIVMEVLRRLDVRSPLEETLLLCDGPLDVSLNTVQERVGQDVTQIRENETGKRTRLIQAKRLVIWPCSQHTLAGSALGLTNTDVLEWVATALWHHRPVSMVLDNALAPLLNSNAAPNAYVDMLRQHVNTLRSFGVQLIALDSLEPGCFAELTPPVDKLQISISGPSSWWTAEDLRQLGATPGEVFVIPQGIRLTPLARDALRDMKAVIRYSEDRESTNR